MKMRRSSLANKLLPFLFCAVLAAPLFASAVTTSTKGYYTMPLLSSDINKINAWVDHSYPGENKALSSSTVPSSTMTMFDGTSWTGTKAASSTCGSSTSTSGCFNGNNGIYFSVARGKDVYAAASGTVKEVGWQSSANHKLGYGYYIWIKYPEYGESVIYGQLKESSTLVSVNSTTTRGMKIAVTSSTGNVVTSTLTFTVLNSLTSSSTANSIDPYGWTGTSTDPWVKFDNGYLWASNAATSSVYNYVTSSYTMTASTTWNANQIYIIQGSLTV